MQKGTTKLYAFSSPAATIAALGLPIVIFLPPLYAEMGLGLSLVGTIFMLTRFFDVGTDPVFGHTSHPSPASSGLKTFASSRSNLPAC
jgi:Na+/melibiose symporter-like transporter